mgnify:CR=1 FL=1
MAQASRARSDTPSLHTQSLWSPPSTQPLFSPQHSPGLADVAELAGVEASIVLASGSCGQGWVGGGGLGRGWELVREPTVKVRHGTRFWLGQA